MVHRHTVPRRLPFARGFNAQQPRGLKRVMPSSFAGKVRRAGGVMNRIGRRRHGFSRHIRSNRHLSIHTNPLFRGRSRKVRRSVLSIPTIATRLMSGVANIVTPYSYNRISLVVQSPTHMFQFYKEYRMLKAVFSVRRRRPPSTVFESASGGNTAAAAREETNDIWWLPWSSLDVPVQHPRQIRSARLLSYSWSVASVRQRCIQTRMINRPLLSLNGNQNSLVSNAVWSNNSNRLPGYQVQSWTSMPWMQVNAQHASSGGNVVSDTGLNILPGWPDENAFDRDGVFGGFLYVDNQSAMLGDEVEYSVKVYFQFRGRKPLGSFIDNTGDLDLFPANISGIFYDTRGLPGGGAATDFSTIHVDGYAGPPDPGDVCFPCGPTPAYVVEPPEEKN